MASGGSAATHERRPPVSYRHYLPTVHGTTYRIALAWAPHDQSWYLSVSGLFSGVRLVPGERVGGSRFRVESSGPLAKDAWTTGARLIFGRN